MALLVSLLKEWVDGQVPEFNAISQLLLGARCVKKLSETIIPQLCEWKNYQSEKKLHQLDENEIPPYHEIW